MSDLQLRDRLDWIPQHNLTASGETRRVGIEIEYAGVAPAEVVACVQSLYAGQHRLISDVESVVHDTKWGDFTIELDASYLKELNEKHGSQNADTSALTTKAVDLLTWATEQIVPWELVTPPIPMDHLWRLPTLINELRRLGALGTHHALHYAFGVHFNPELPRLDAETILSYLQAFICLYHWIVEKDRTDTTRKLTTYIQHFEPQYITKVLNPAYAPTLEQLMADYLQANPTRNRSLDLLPLFAHFDENRVRAHVTDPRIKARPTLHYRLSNCDIDNPRWNLDRPWSYWLEVEKLAADPTQLKDVCQTCLTDLKRTFDPITREWR